MSDFVPRLTKEGMYQNVNWYSSSNPFYVSGYGLPNCTCYAWGRHNEISGIVPQLPRYDAKDWYDDVNENVYHKGQIPALGAIACWDEPGDPDGSGHVAVVEKIDETGIWMSESRYRRPVAPYPPDTDHYFDLTHFNETTKRLDWMYSGLRFRGYIYNPYAPIPRRTIPIWLLLKMKEMNFRR